MSPSRLAAFVPAIVVLAASGFATGAAAQGAPAPTRKPGVVFKEEVDGLVGALTADAKQHGWPLGGGNGEARAKILAAMARCHRRYYYPGDVPAVTQAVQALIAERRSDGSFGDAATTAWAIEALANLPLEPRFGDELAAARAWLAQAKAAASGFESAVTAVLDGVRADVFPQHLGADAAAKAKAWRQSHEGMNHAEAAEALVRLVACQVANTRLDGAAAPTADATWSPAQDKAAQWLMARQKDGVFEASYGGKTFPDAAMTGFGLYALQTKPKARRSAAEQAAIDKGMQWLLAGQNADGTFGQSVPNYTTCLVVGALHRWGGAGVAPALAKAQQAILGFQNAEAGGYARSDRDYGSIGYGSSQRGDLSNLHFSLQALRETGLPADHEAFQKALTFLQRTQNLKSTNDFQGKVPDPDREGVVLDSTSGDDGGAGYYPGNSNAGYIVHPDGKTSPRSYGSMTYALLKSYTLAGVPGDDARVQAAVKWIQENWTLAVNPGADPAMGEKVRYQGLFYYYMVLAQALDAAKVQTVRVAQPAVDGKSPPPVAEVDWRKALRAQLEGMQAADGTWRNGKNDRWMEGQEMLCTCYAMTALELCR
ncbi:MAG: prenyltransferase/squalene oxidase repeat-containing protein [Planctomycetota bacterium]